MKYPDDFKHIVYNDSQVEIQKTIDEYIAKIEESKGEIDKIETGNISVEKLGNRYHVTVRSDCWIPKK